MKGWLVGWLLGECVWAEMRRRGRRGLSVSRLAKRSAGGAQGCGGGDEGAGAKLDCVRFAEGVRDAEREGAVAGAGF